jgi:hypothetical protein
LASAAAVAIVEKTRIVIVEAVHTLTIHLVDALIAAATSNCRIRRVKDERREPEKDCELTQARNLSFLCLGH